jgi:hypothetical protein
MSQRKGLHSTGIAPAGELGLDDVPSVEQVGPPAGTHAPEVQVNPLAQSAGAEQLVLHMLLVESQAKFELQSVVVPVTHTPFESQIIEVVWCEPAHTEPQEVSAPG